MAESQSSDNNTCVVCFKNVEYYSIGECDHPVCFECSTRMRVLCLQNECPICRQALSRVVFTDTVQPYKELRNQVFTDRLFERQFKIGFSSEQIKQAYDTLLENCCKLCSKIPPFRTFSQLSDHMRKVHERYYCDLCVKHLKIFTAERKCYTRQELAHHRRKGDLDDTSHRGHPLCEFCEERFMDADELYRHLRKEHLYCHLCDADGRNLYYASHSALAHHFRTDHFLCEEGDCAGNHLTAVFRTEIDLKAHKAKVHGRGMTRGAARQARTIEVQFNITPHSAQVVQRTARERERSESPPPVPAAPRIDTRSDEQFPRLSAAGPAAGPLLAAPNRAYNSVDGLARTDKNFPTLGGAPAGPSRAAAPRSNSKPAVSIQLHSQPASASNFRLTQTSGHRASAPQPAAPRPAAPRRAPLCDDDFPELSAAPRDDHPSLGAATTQPPKVTMINSQEMQAMQKKSNQLNSQPKKVSMSVEAFPALSAAAAPAAPPQWITVAKEKGKPKPKPEPASPPRQPAFNHVADFPTLPVNTKKSKKSSPLQSAPAPPRAQPAPARPQPPPQPETKASKKEKKKQNNIKNAAKENTEPSPPMYVNGFSDKLTKQQIKEAYSAAVSLDGSPPAAVAKVRAVQEAAGARADSRNAGNGDFALAANDYPPLAPPGFSSARPPCDGMTFTNSAGQTFPAPPHAYVPPPDFERRNRELVQRFVDALGSAAAVTEFKAASRAFRDDSIDADQFYAHCRRAMGAQLDDVFPDLVALLPDIRKQQELAAGRPLGARLHCCAACGQLLAPPDRAAHDRQHAAPRAR